MNPQPLAWEAIAARVSVDTSPVAEEPPFGFATRVVTAWRVAQRDEGLRRWTRWSLRAALGSVAICALLAAKDARSYWDSSLKPVSDPASVADNKLEITIQHFHPKLDDLDVTQMVATLRGLGYTVTPPEPQVMRNFDGFGEQRTGWQR